MTVYHAVKTMAAIESSMKADQGAAYRVWLGKVIPHIGDAYRGADLPFRSHMGASGLGKKCERAIWYGFRWATKPNFDGRMLRLFNRGHLEEARFIALLLSIGCEVYQQDSNGKQFRISDAGGHLGGSGDGLVMGLPDLDSGTVALCEFKTACEKKFLEMQSNGLREANFTYFVQTQLYMGKMGYGVTLFMMTNKNTDHIYAELVVFDPAIYERYLDRGVTLVFTEQPPKKLSESPGYYECKFCDHYAVCHKGETPAKTCRSCHYAIPERDGTWTCNNGPKRVLTTLEQYTACDKYERKF